MPRPPRLASLVRRVVSIHVDERLRRSCVRCDVGRSSGEREDTLLEAGGERVVRELTAQIAGVDRLAEDCSLPEGERLEPREVGDVATAAALVVFDQLLSLGEAGERGHWRQLEWHTCAGGVGVR